MTRSSQPTSADTPVPSSYLTPVTQVPDKEGTTRRTPFTELERLEDKGGVILLLLEVTSPTPTLGCERGLSSVEYDFKCISKKSFPVESSTNRYT